MCEIDRQIPLKGLLSVDSRVVGMQCPMLFSVTGAILRPHCVRTNCIREMVRRNSNPVPKESAEPTGNNRPELAEDARVQSMQHQNLHSLILQVKLEDQVGPKKAKSYHKYYVNNVLPFFITRVTVKVKFFLTERTTLFLLK